MSTYEDVSVVGRAKYLEARLPTASEAGAKVKDRFVDTTTGIIYSCIVDTFGSQQWLGADGNTVPVAILATDHPNLIAMYTMDNISGATILDETANNNDGTIVGAVAVAGGIGLGNTLDFDGTNDKVGFGPAVLTGQTHAISLWGNFDSFATTQALFGRYTQGSTYQGVYAYITAAPNITLGTVQSNGNLYFGRDTLGPLLQINTDYHIVIQFSPAGVMELYVNAAERTLVNILSSGVVSTINYPASRQFTIGATEDSTGSVPYYTDGTIEQVRVFDRFLTQEEITALYNEGNP